MSAAKDGASSPLADFFTKASAETKRDVYNAVISKAIASQRAVLEKAETIKKANASAEKGA
ncbi:hypothetical protein [Pseudomonas nunensis]|uniref:Glycine/sarcosine/betaine reductase component B subunit n=1 Tax=Pseudomonas nunensis TaxID=2961896 RepID=A0ABY5ECN9_9PSED|nr:hypothetical protein [Pseudomonas nunensis]KOX98979.1 hypothetical protein AM274_27760 [Pseudomonas nunensis]KPN91881.1 hypothetical protein AL066_16660 [Pseudomonas nunensis]MCL5229402.1 glycine/sarcosine/betaine reductase component B subunit [Pseudomonas nunensis]UTO12097.1 glycine/sarcosine/betaine reductase component B subunit [Pseudomonas nunensis]